MNTGRTESALESESWENEGGAMGSGAFRASNRRELATCGERPLGCSASAFDVPPPETTLSALELEWRKRLSEDAQYIERVLVDFHGAVTVDVVIASSGLTKVRVAAALLELKTQTPAWYAHTLGAPPD